MSDVPDPAPEPPALDDAIRERGVLMGLGYRLLGSVVDAEDLVQETYIRWYRLPQRDRDAIESVRGWLIRTASRIGLDMLTSARARRETYVGEWLPEPLPSSDGRATGWVGRAPDPLADPADRITLDESVSMALLVVLEKLTPPERVAFVLHEVFGYSYPEVGAIVGRSADASRQLGASARRRLHEERRVPAPADERAAVVRSFRAAWESGNLAGLVAVLDPDAVAVTDGGGVVSASVEPLRGADSVAAFLVAVHDLQHDLSVREVEVNGEPGLLATGGGEVLAVLSFRMRDGRVDEVWAVRNPGKLTPWCAV